MQKNKYVKWNSSRILPPRELLEQRHPSKMALKIQCIITRSIFFFSIGFSKFIPRLLTVPGVLWGVPRKRSATVLYGNKDFWMVMVSASRPARFEYGITFIIFFIPRMPGILFGVPGEENATVMGANISVYECLAVSISGRHVWM